MAIISDEHIEIANFLLPYVIDLAKTHDGLVEPDEATEKIMLRCFGVGFSLGVAFNKTPETFHWRKRLDKAFEIMRKGR